MPYQFKMTRPQRTLVRKVFLVDPGDIGYLRFTLESYDGMAIMGTLDADGALIQISISPECMDTVLELLEALRQEEGLRIEPCYES